MSDSLLIHFSFLQALSLCKRLLTLFHGYSKEQLSLFQQLHFYCHLYLISLQTKLSSHIRLRCLKHLQWQQDRKMTVELDEEVDRKLSLNNLISYAQKCVAILSRTLLFVQGNFLTAHDPIRMVSVAFLEPESDPQQVLEFLPGLSVSIPCLMNVKNLDQQQNLNIKVNRILVESFSDLKPRFV